MSLFFKRTMGSSLTRVIHWIVMSAENGELLVNPPFQRGSVWTQEQREAWIETILDDLPRPAFFMNESSFVRGAYEDKVVVIDGRQRIEAILDFVAGKFPVRGEYYTDQDDQFHRQFMMSTIPVIQTEYETEEECMELYVRLLRCGTAHTEEEIQNAEKMLQDKG